MYPSLPNSLLHSFPPMSHLLAPSHFSYGSSANCQQKCGQSHLFSRLNSSYGSFPNCSIKRAESTPVLNQLQNCAKLQENSGSHLRCVFFSLPLFIISSCFSFCCQQSGKTPLKSQMAARVTSRPLEKPACSVSMKDRTNKRTNTLRSLAAPSFPENTCTRHPTYNPQVWLVVPSPETKLTFREYSNPHQQWKNNNSCHNKNPRLFLINSLSGLNVAVAPCVPG